MRARVDKWVRTPASVLHHAVTAVAAAGAGGPPSPTAVRSTLRVRLQAGSVPIPTVAVVVITPVPARLAILRACLLPDGGETSRATRLALEDGIGVPVQRTRAPTLPASAVRRSVVGAGIRQVLRRTNAATTRGGAAGQRPRDALVGPTSHSKHGDLLAVFVTPLGTDSGGFSSSTYSSCGDRACGDSDFGAGVHGRSGSGAGRARNQRRSSGNGHKQTKGLGRLPSSCLRGSS